MENWNSLVNKWSSLGPVSPIARFIVASIEPECYNSMRLPDGFHEVHSLSFPSRLGFKCSNSVWKVKYDEKNKSIYGICKLMRFLKVKPCDLLIVNYYGHGLFQLRVFRPTGIEYCYPKFNRKEHLKPCYGDHEKDLFDKQSVEFENNLSLLWFNSVGRVASFYEMSIFSLSVHPNIVGLLLYDEMEQYYKSWKTGDKVTLKLAKLEWKIEIDWTENGCHFGKGWLHFAKDTNLKGGDTLVIWKPKQSEDYTLNVCILKASILHHEKRNKTGPMCRSFFKIIQKIDLKLGEIVVPKYVVEDCGEYLVQIKEIKVSGDTWNIEYDDKHRVLKNLHKMFADLGVKEYETLILSVKSKHAVALRIFRSDGVEINYNSRRMAFDENVVYENMWRLDFSIFQESNQVIDNVQINDQMEEFPKEEGLEIKRGTGSVNDDMNVDAEREKALSDENNAVYIEISDSDASMEEAAHNLPEEDLEAIHNAGLEFSIQLSKCHVDKKTHGVVIPKDINPSGRAWRKTDSIIIRTDIGVWNLGLVMHNGRARFCAGWNRFVAGNQYATNDVLQFRMRENDDGISFDVVKFRQ